MGGAEPPSLDSDISVPLLEDLDLRGKKIFVRLDINAPIEPATGAILDDSKFRAHARTIRELLEEGCSLVLASHQGRPGASDYVDTSAHAKKIAEVLSVEVKWVDDVMGPAARQAIMELKRGEVLLLDNLRFVAEENVEADPDTQARSVVVRRLHKLFDAYVNDAFASAHRSHPSIVGFPLVLPSAAGRLFESELRAVQKVYDPVMSPKVFVLGGSKLEDTVKIIESLVKRGKVDKILATGLVAELFSVAMGVELGPENEKVLEKVGAPKLLERSKRLLASGAPIEVPVDYVVERDGEVEVRESHDVAGLIRDIGPATLEKYGEELKRAKLIVMRGPAGVVEDPRFERGTEELVKIAIESGAFVLIGGGHLGAVARKFDVGAERVYVSTGGGALLSLLSGESLPAIEALKISARKFLGWR